MRGTVTCTLPERMTVPAETAVVDRCHGQLVADVLRQQSPQVVGGLKATASLAYQPGERRLAADVA